MATRMVVVGGGILGVSAAWTLARLGAKVTLVDRGYVGQGSTARAAGVVSDLTWSAQDRLWVRESRERYAHPPEGRAAEVFRQVGSVTWADGDAATRLRERAREAAAAGTPLEILDRRETADRFPALRLPDEGVAAVVPGDGVVNASDYCAQAARAAAAAGAEIRERHSARLDRDGGGWRVTADDGAVLSADAVLVAAGAWSRGLLAGAGVPVPLRPYRTQAVTVTHPEVARLPTGVFHDGGTEFYWVPESGGRILMGDGTEERPVDPDAISTEPDGWFLESVARRLEARTERGREGALGRGWAGVCTATPDRRPLLGPIPGAEGLWIAAGMNGFGVMRGPAVGAAVGRWMATGDGSAVPDPCRASRFPDGAVEFAIRQGYAI